MVRVSIASNMKSDDSTPFQANCMLAVGVAIGLDVPIFDGLSKLDVATVSAPLVLLASTVASWKGNYVSVLVNQRAY